MFLIVEMFYSFPSVGVSRSNIVAYTGPGTFFGLRFLMAEFSSEVFRVLFKHGLGIFSCCFSCFLCQGQVAFPPVELGKLISLPFCL